MGSFAFQLDVTTGAPCETTNTALVANLVALGVGIAGQKTTHVANGTTYDTWNLAGLSTTWPDLTTQEAAKMWGEGRLELSDARPLTGWQLSLHVGMRAFEARKLIIDAAQTGRRFHLVREPQGFCRAVPTSDITAPYDLQEFVRNSAAIKATAQRIGQLKLATAAMILGFPMISRDPEGRFLLPAESLTRPGLHLAHLTPAASLLNDHNINGGPTPFLDLPGSPPGYHPFQHIFQALHNFDQLKAIIRGTHPTAFLQSQKNRQRAALVSLHPDTPREEIAAAVKHTGVKF